MSSIDWSWLILRVTYAGLFLYPIPGLIKDWRGTVAASGLLTTKFSEAVALTSLFVMFFGGLSILFGVWGRIGAMGLLVFNLGGTALHYRLAEQALESRLTDNASEPDQQVFKRVVALAAAGHRSSAWKNYVLAAIACFFIIQGTGPYSFYH